MKRRFLAAFHTHASAMLSARELRAAGACGVRMAPVPRELSSSCGTCVLYEAEDALENRLDEDAEAVYTVTEKDGATAYALEYRFPDA